MFKKLTAVLAALSLTLLGAVSANAATVSETSGYDVSYPQCGKVLPTSFAFAVVGVNGGRVWDQHKCLDEMLTWAGEGVQLYINTGNPNPTQSSHWPRGKKVAGVKCDRSYTNSNACSWVYGYLGAKDSYAKAVQGFKDAGFSSSPADRMWWLDVELSNSWRQGAVKDELTQTWSTQVSSRNQSRNRAALSGAVYYLENVARVKEIGIYSTSKQWGIITGGLTKEFSDHAVWYANGPGDEALALGACDGLKNDGQPDEISSGFTGSAAIISQYVDTDLDLDVNVPCTGYLKTVSSFAPADIVTKHGRKFSLQARLLTTYGTPAANREVSLTFNGQSFVVRTDANGYAIKRLRAGVVGTYPLTATFAGDTILAATSADYTVTVR
ncbi:MAG: hypothetical protein ACKOWE_05475 [Micrococcales bacterium]